ncbi:MAG: hypothetical protein PHS37_09270, partial [Candidatus Omnitrophica bacterium]|nr:hypothetical protein [Candidatus Omnitrophota bacterium]
SRLDERVRAGEEIQLNVDGLDVLGRQDFSRLVLIDRPSLDRKNQQGHVGISRNCVYLTRKAFRKSLTGSNNYLNHEVKELSLWRQWAVDHSVRLNEAREKGWHVAARIHLEANLEYPVHPDKELIADDEDLSFFSLNDGTLEAIKQAIIDPSVDTGRKIEALRELQEAYTFQYGDRFSIVLAVGKICPCLDEVLAASHESPELWDAIDELLKTCIECDYSSESDKEKIARVYVRLIENPGTGRHIVEKVMATCREWCGSGKLVGAGIIRSVLFSGKEHLSPYMSMAGESLIVLGEMHRYGQGLGAMADILIADARVPFALTKRVLQSRLRFLMVAPTFDSEKAGELITVFVKKTGRTKKEGRNAALQGLSDVYDSLIPRHQAMIANLLLTYRSKILGAIADDRAVILRTASPDTTYYLFQEGAFVNALFDEGYGKAMALKRRLYATERSTMKKVRLEDAELIRQIGKGELPDPPDTAVARTVYKLPWPDFCAMMAKHYSIIHDPDRTQECKEALREYFAQKEQRKTTPPTAGNGGDTGIVLNMRGLLTLAGLGLGYAVGSAYGLWWGAAIALGAGLIDLFPHYVAYWIKKAILKTIRGVSPGVHYFFLAGYNRNISTWLDRTLYKIIWAISPEFYVSILKFFSASGGKQSASLMAELKKLLLMTTQSLAFTSTVTLQGMKTTVLSLSVPPVLKELALSILVGTIDEGYYILRDTRDMAAGIVRDIILSPDSRLSQEEESELFLAYCHYAVRRQMRLTNDLLIAFAKKYGKTRIEGTNVFLKKAAGWCRTDADRLNDEILRQIGAFMPELMDEIVDDRAVILRTIYEAFWHQEWLDRGKLLVFGTKKDAMRFKKEAYIGHLQNKAAGLSSIPDRDRAYANVEKVRHADIPEHAVTVYKLPWNDFCAFMDDHSDLAHDPAKAEECMVALKEYFVEKKNTNIADDGSLERHDKVVETIREAVGEIAMDQLRVRAEREHLDPAQVREEEEYIKGRLDRYEDIGLPVDNVHVYRIWPETTVIVIDRDNLDGISQQAHAGIYRDQIYITRKAFEACVMGWCNYLRHEQEELSLWHTWAIQNEIAYKDARTRGGAVVAAEIHKKAMKKYPVNPGETADFFTAEKCKNMILADTYMWSEKREALNHLEKAFEKGDMRCARILAGMVISDDPAVSGERKEDIVEYFDMVYGHCIPTAGEGYMVDPEKVCDRENSALLRDIVIHAKTPDDPLKNKIIDILVTRVVDGKEGADGILKQMAMDNAVAPQWRIEILRRLVRSWTFDRKEPAQAALIEWVPDLKNMVLDEKTPAPLASAAISSLSTVDTEKTLYIIELVGGLAALARDPVARENALIYLGQGAGMGAADALKALENMITDGDVPLDLRVEAATKLGKLLTSSPVSP